MLLNIEYIVIWGREVLYSFHAGSTFDCTISRLYDAEKVLTGFADWIAKEMKINK